MSLNGIFQRTYSEFRAKGMSYADLAATLEQSKQTVLNRWRGASDSARNRGTASHIIGIERWGQRRLRALLGEPLVIDEYDGYRPDPATPMPQLVEQFDQTRQATLALLQQLEAQAVPLTQSVRHNELGPLSIGGWIVYLTSHGSRETLGLIW